MSVFSWTRFSTVPNPLHDHFKTVWAWDMYSDETFSVFTEPHPLRFSFFWFCLPYARPAIINAALMPP